jgi:YD repeat-containing protein
LGSTTTVVDSLGRPVSVTDGKGQVTRTTYNVNDQVTQVLTGGATTCSYAAGTCVASTYDADGNLATQTDQTGLTTYTYDNLDRQINKRLPSGPTWLRATTRWATWPATPTRAGPSPTASTRPTSSPPHRAQRGGTAFGYNNDAVRTSTTYPGGTVMANTPDNSMRTQEIKATNGSNVFSDFTYSYANGSADTSLNRARTDKVAGANTSYAYDALNRLTQATETTGATPRPAGCTATTAMMLGCCSLGLTLATTGLVPLR